MLTREKKRGLPPSDAWETCTGCFCFHAFMVAGIMSIQIMFVCTYAENMYSSYLETPKAAVTVLAFSKAPCDGTVLHAQMRRWILNLQKQCIIVPMWHYVPLPSSLKRLPDHLFLRNMQINTEPHIHTANDCLGQDWLPKQKRYASNQCWCLLFWNQTHKPMRIMQEYANCSGGSQSVTNVTHIGSAGAHNDRLMTILYKLHSCLFIILSLSFNYIFFYFFY